MFFEIYITSRVWYVHGKIVWKNPLRAKNLDAKMEGNKDATKIDPMKFPGQLKEKINLFMLLLGIFQDKFWGLQNYF